MYKAFAFKWGKDVKKTDKKKLLELINQFDQSRILVLGDFILDQFVWGTVDRISPEAPVPVVSVERESYMPGGALNVANNIRTLGGTVYPSGVVGRDIEGRMLVKAMRREGIETEGVIYDEGRRTTLKTRVIAHSQQVVRFDREKIDEISKDDQNKILKYLHKKAKAVDVIIVEDYGKGVIQPKMIAEIIELARKRKIPVIVDPKEKHFNYYTGATVITPNRKEAYGAIEQFSAQQNLSIEEVGNKLLKQLKLKAVLMTLGEGGMALFEKDGAVTKIATVAREVYDVSGAGDTVIAVFSMALAVKGDLKQAAQIANIAAGIAVGKLGTSTVSVEELKNYIEQDI